jgi:hypothetical protein
VNHQLMAGFGQPPDLAFYVAEQLSALRRDISEAETMTCRAGLPGLGDARLWAYTGRLCTEPGTGC